MGPLDQRRALVLQSGGPAALDRTVLFNRGDYLEMEHAALRDRVSLALVTGVAVALRLAVDGVLAKGAPGPEGSDG